MKKVGPKFAPGEILDVVGFMALTNKMGPREYSYRGIDNWLRVGVAGPDGGRIKPKFRQIASGSRYIRYEDAVEFLNAVFGLEPGRDPYSLKMAKAVRS